MAILKSTRDVASVDEPGKVSLATLQEALDGLSSAKAMTPAGTKAVIDQLIGGAPELLDTLNELAAAINDDENYAATVQATLTSLQNQINTLSGGDLSAITTEIDAIETGAGLESDGTYTADSGSNYITSATSLKDADSKLDAQIKTNADAIATLGNGNLSAIQSEIDSIESSVGIGTDGSYTAQSGNYIGSASSVRGEISALDTQVKSNADAISSLGSGNIANLQSELDATQASVGTNTDGTYSAHSGSNYMDSDTSVKGALSSLDGQIKTNEDAIALKASSSSVSALDSDLSALTTRVTTAEGEIDTLQTEMDAVEASVALKADDSDLTALDGRVTTAEGEIDTLQTESADYESRITSLEGASSNQAEVDAIEASVGIGTDGSYTAPSGTNYIDSATSVRDEIVKLDTQVKNRADSISTNATNIATNTSDISGKADSSTVSAISTELTATQAAAGFNADGTYSAHSGSNYIDGATTTKSALGLLDAQVQTNETDITNLTATVATITSEGDSNSDAIDALQLELDNTQTGAGLSGTGAYTAPGSSNYLASATSLKDADNKLDAQIKTNADAIALRALDTDLDAVDTRLTTAEGEIDTLQSEMDSVEADVLTLQGTVSGHTTSIASLDTDKAEQSDLDATNTELTATQASVGLNTDGTYSAHSGSNYIDGSSTVKGALGTLDGQIKSNADAITSNDSDIATNASDITTLETLADTHETAIGLSASGAYQSRSGSNYLDTATSIRNEITKLDTQAKTNADAISSEASTRASAVSTLTSSVSTLQSEVDATQAGAGLDSDGGYTANSGTNYISSVSTLKAADEALDTQIKTNADAIATNASDISDLESDVALLASSSSVSALQTEVDAIESGVGLSSSGAYSTPAGHNYLGQSTLKADLASLDGQVKTNADSITTNASDIDSLETLANTHESSIGLSAAGAYVSRSGSNYLDTASSVVGEATLLDAQVKTNADAIATKASSSSVSALQTEVDNVETAVGLDTDGTFISFSGQNFLNSASSLKGGMELLDAAIQARQDNIDSEASTRASADNTLSGKIDTVEASVGLQTDGSLSITGTNFLNSASSVVGALEILDTNVNFTSQVQGNIRSSAGLQSDGTKTAYSSTNYISGSLKAALEALDTQVKSNADSITGLGGSDIANLQTELDDTQAGVGLDSNGDYVSRSGTNYLDSATSIVGEITALDTQAKTNADAIATKAPLTQTANHNERLELLEHRCGGIFLDHSSDDAVEMDATLSRFRAHSGPFEVNFATLISTGEADIIHFGNRAAVNSDKNFVADTTGDVIFTGKPQEGDSVLDGVTLSNQYP